METLLFLVPRFLTMKYDAIDSHISNDTLDLKRVEYIKEK